MADSPEPQTDQGKPEKKPFPVIIIPFAVIIGLCLVCGIVGRISDIVNGKPSRAKQAALAAQAPTPIPSPTRTPSPTPTAQEIRERKVKAAFSPWDGSHRGLVGAVKQRMHDPDSFDHARTAFEDKGDHILVRMEYRGKNAFGALVLNQTAARCDIDGNVIEFVE